MARKKNIPVVCKHCKRDFLSYNSPRQEFCSRECSYQYRRDLRPSYTCETCGKPIQKNIYTSTRNDKNYCNRTCYHLRKKDNLRRVKRHTQHFTRLVEEGCACGVKEYYLLQIHHRDGDVTNNDPENHEVVCANCHIKRHLKLNKKGKLVYHTKTLTRPEIFKLL